MDFIAVVGGDDGGFRGVGPNLDGLSALSVAALTVYQLFLSAQDTRMQASQLNLRCVEECACEHPLYDIFPQKERMAAQSLIPKFLCPIDIIALVPVCRRAYDASFCETRTS